MKRIETSGFSCPEPVIMTKKALKDSPDALTVIVDNVASRENVKRFGEATGYKVDVKEEGSKWTLVLAR